MHNKNAVYCSICIVLYVFSPLPVFETIHICLHRSSGLSSLYLLILFYHTSSTSYFPFFILSLLISVISYKNNEFLLPRIYYFLSLWFMVVLTPVCRMIPIWFRSVQVKESPDAAHAPVDSLEKLCPSKWNIALINVIILTWIYRQFLVNTTTVKKC